MTDRHPLRRGPLLFVVVVAPLSLMLPACEGGGNFKIFGYSSRANYDCDIKTIYVPIFKNRTFQRQLEMDLTRAVIRDIEFMTPFKVVSKPEGADTELIGTIVSMNKNLVNINPENEVREAEMYLGVEILWRNRRTGEVLTKQARPPNAPVPGTPGYAGPGLNSGLPQIQQDPTGPAPLYRTPDDALPGPVATPPVIISSTGHDIPELGQSTATGKAQMVDQMAINIVSMMEKPW